MRQGFVAALTRPDGSVLVATSSRWEQSGLYAVHGGTLFVATHPRDLIQALPAPPPLRIAKLVDLVVLHDEPATTVYDGVDRIPNGHALRWSPGGAVTVRRWFAPSTEEDRSIPASAAPALLREAVRDAVAASLPDEGDVAATLSGGLDSSAVTAVAAGLVGPSRTIHAFTHVPLAGTPDPAPRWEADDGPYAEAVAASLPNVKWTPFANTARVPPLDSAAAAIERSWQPSFNPPNQGWIDEMLRRAEDAGSGVLLTGASGNATFSRSSDGVLRGLACRGRLDLLARQVRSRHAAGTSWRRAGRTVLRDALPLPVLAWRRALLRRPPLTSVEEVWEEMPARREALSDAARDGLARLVAGGRLDTRARWIGFVLADHARLGAGQNLSDAVWWSDPLSDPEVMALALRLPEDAWLAGGRDRGLAREAAAGLVPDVVRLRTTYGAQASDCGQWVLGQEPAYRALLERFRASPSVGEFLDLDALEAAVGPELTDPATASTWQDVYGRAFGLGQFAVWYEDEVLGRRRGM